VQICPAEERCFTVLRVFGNGALDLVKYIPPDFVKSVKPVLLRCVVNFLHEWGNPPKKSVNNRALLPIFVKSF